MNKRLIMGMMVVLSGFADAAEPGRHRFDAGKDAPALYYDAIRPIETGSMADVAVVLIHGWGGYVRMVYPAWKRQASFHVFEGIGHQEDLAYPTKDVLDFVFDGR